MATDEAVESFLTEMDALPHEVELSVGHLRLHVRLGDEDIYNQLLRYYKPFVCSDDHEPEVEVSQWASHDGVDEEYCKEMYVYGWNRPAVYDEKMLLDQPREKGPAKQSFYTLSTGTLVVYRKRSDIVYYLKKKRYYAVGDLQSRMGELHNLVSFAYTQTLRSLGYIALHASAMSINGRGIGFAGTGGMGKTTAALTFLEMGFDYITNDRLLVKSSVVESGEVVVSGVPKWPRVNPGSLLTLPKLRTLVEKSKRKKYKKMSWDTLWAVEDKHDVHVPEIYGIKKLTMYATLDTLCIFTWKPAGTSSCSPVGSGDVFVSKVPPQQVGRLLCPLLKQKLMDPGDLRPPSSQFLAKLFQNVNVLHIAGSFNLRKLLAVLTGNATSLVTQPLLDRLPDLYKEQDKPDSDDEDSDEPGDHPVPMTPCDASHTLTTRSTQVVV